jgi:hypothetical protein
VNVWPCRILPALLLVPIALAAQSPTPSPRALPPEDPAPRKVDVRAAPVLLNPEKPDQHSIGRLRYRGGVHLTSSDPRFGGFSSVRLSHDGRRLTLVSDEGSWLAASIVRDERGFLTGLADAEMGPLVDLDGAPLVEKDDRDAESLAILADGSFLVGFERQHRIWHYGGDNGRLKGPADAIPNPPGLSEAPFNGGIESLVALPKGRLFAMTEYGIKGDLIRGWIGTTEDWRPLGFRFERALRPSDAALLPWGDLVVLERAYNPDRGIVGVRLRQISRDALRPEATLGGRIVADIEPPVTLDNFEGIDCQRYEKGTLCFVVSDDNLNPQQRTLLLLFALEGR